MTLDDCRTFYADEIRIAANLRPTSDLIRAFASVPRENYLGPAPWQICSTWQLGCALVGLSNDMYATTDNPRDLYHDVLVAIDPARHLNNGQPSALAFWMAALDIKRGDRIYHAGCGVGYYTAILAEMTGPGGSVVSIDVDPDLAARAKQNLSGYSHVTVHAGDGAALDPGMCDAMLINAGVTDLHRPWLDRLKDGGRLVLPLTGKGGTGVMARITRQPAGLAASVVSVVSIYSSTSLRDPEIEPLLTSALADRRLLKLKSVRLDEHTPDDACIVHAPKICLSSHPL